MQKSSIFGYDFFRGGQPAAGGKKLWCKSSFPFQDKSSGSCGRNLRNSRLLKKSGTVIDKDFGVICVLKNSFVVFLTKGGIGKSLESR